MVAPAPGRAATPSHTELARRAYVAPEDTDAVDAAELQRRLNPADAVILDVRPGSQYAGGHLSGALHIPLEELADRLAELPRDDDIIACCRAGTACSPTTPSGSSPHADARLGGPPTASSNDGGPATPSNPTLPEPAPGDRPER